MSRTGDDNDDMTALSSIAMNRTPRAVDRAFNKLAQK
jgi:hypothetical protein